MLAHFLPLVEGRGRRFCRQAGRVLANTATTAAEQLSADGMLWFSSAVEWFCVAGVRNMVSMLRSGKEALQCSEFCVCSISAQ
jgi:hypothetical protein